MKANVNDECTLNALQADKSFVNNRFFSIIWLLCFSQWVHGIFFVLFAHQTAKEKKEHQSIDETGLFFIHILLTGQPGLVDICRVCSEQRIHSLEHVWQVYEGEAEANLHLIFWHVIQKPLIIRLCQLRTSLLLGPIYYDFIFLRSTHEHSDSGLFFLKRPA